MDQTAKKALEFLYGVKSLSIATINNGEPAVRIADVMLLEEDGLYFITARGKPYIHQIDENKKIAVCGMDQNRVTVRVVGDVRICEDRGVLDKVFEKNPLLGRLYPGEKSRILEAFHLYKGKGEFFDLSVRPPRRDRFAFGGETVNPPGYWITDKCTDCGLCPDVCPVNVISPGEIYTIDRNHCLECGACLEICPAGAVEATPGM